MKVSGFMIDLDGTIYKGSQLIPGAREFISALKKNDIPFVFLTNNSSFSRDHYLNKLNGLGLDIGMNNVLSSTTATVRYLKENRTGKKVFPLGTEDLLRELREADIEISNDDPDIVLLAFDKTITYQKMNDAYHLLINGREFIATHPDDLCPTEDGYDIDIGPFIRFFEQMTGAKATVIGKPNKLMVEMAAKEMNVDTEGLVMVGDRLYTDIKMAEDAGIHSVLVLSGETSGKDLIELKIKPSFVVENVGEIVQKIPEFTAR